MSDITGREFLVDNYSRAIKKTNIRGAVFFGTGAVLAVVISWEWKGGPVSWVVMIVSIILGLYGFLNIKKSVSMPKFEKSPIGLFISGEQGKSPEALLIRRSEEELKDTDKFKAVISFIDKTGGGENVVVKGYGMCQTVAEYLKEKLDGKCEIYDMTFKEYEEKKQEYAASAAASEEDASEDKPSPDKKDKKDKKEK
jgi:hypothetical protein